MTTTALAAWATAVKARDGKCLECGSTDDLHAHHNIPKSVRPDLALDVDNGRTLCYRCHKRWHEQNRPQRIRSGRPQRRTLETKLAELQAEVERLTLENARLTKQARRLQRPRTVLPQPSRVTSEFMPATDGSVVRR